MSANIEAGSAASPDLRPAVTSAAAASLLGFESGGEYWLIDLADAGEVLPVPVLSPVPLTKAWFCGIANIRGTLYGVSDLAAFHGFEPTPVKAQSRLLLAGARAGSHQGSNTGSNMALLMAATQGLKVLAKLEAMPATHDPTQSWRGAAYRDGEGRTWTRLLLPALFGAPRFLDIAA